MCNTRAHKAIEAVKEATAVSQALFGDMIKRDHLYTTSKKSAESFLSALNGLVRSWELGSKVRVAVSADPCTNSASSCVEMPNDLGPMRSKMQDPRHEAAEIMYRMYGGVNMGKIDIQAEDIRIRVFTDVSFCMTRNVFTSKCVFV